MKKVLGWLAFVALAAGVIVADYFLFRWYKPLALAITLGFYKAFLGDLMICLNKRLPDDKKIRRRDAFTGNKLSTLFSFLDFFGCAWCGSTLYVYMTRFSVPAAWKAFAFWLIGFIGFIFFHHLCCKLFGREPYEEDAKEDQKRRKEYMEKQQYEDFIGDQQIDRMTEDSIWTPILLVAAFMLVVASIKSAGLRPLACLLIGMAVSGIWESIDMYLCFKNNKKHKTKDVPPEQPVGFSRDLLDRHDKDVCENVLDYINEGLSDKKEGRP